MGAQEYATGAVHIFVKGGKSSAMPTAKYLGTGEQGPQRQTDRNFKAVMNDLKSQKPFDYVFAGGQEAVLSFVLTRWDEAVASNLESAPVSGGWGESDIRDHGTLMGQEGYAYEVWYLYTFGGLAARPSMVDQEACRHYVQCLFWGPEQDTIGAVERKKHFVFKAWEKFISTARPYPKFVLFDDDSSGISINLIT